MTVSNAHLELAIELREADDSNPDVAASFDGVAMPYGEETRIGGIRESFAPDSIDPASLVGMPITWRHGEPVGVITGAENREGALRITGDVSATAQGRDAATLLRTKAVKGLSVGFDSITQKWNRTRDAVTHTKANVFEVALTHMPAYANAGVSAVREGNNAMSDTDTIEAPSVDDGPKFATADEVQALRERVATIGTPRNAEETHPLAEYRSMGDFHRAVLDGKIENRALVDQITTNNPGVMAPNWMQDIKGIVNLGRPAITAFGAESAGPDGMDYNWPFFDGDLAAIVKEQATEKTDINSVRIDIKKASASLKTLAAGSDISFQLLQRSSPSYLTAHNRIMLASYAVVSDTAFCTGLVAGATAQAGYDVAADADGKKFKAEMFKASVAVETATGSPANVVLVATDVFLKAGGWDGFVPTAYGTQNVPGTAQASTLAVEVSGLRVIHDRNLPAGTIIVGSSEAAKFIEDGPRLIDAVAVSKLGQDVAVYGFGVPALYIPKGVIKVVKTAAP
jgi:HK97 family phage prohead protease